MIRPFDWRDLPILHRYRNQGLCLNSALGLTRGTAISSTVLLSYLTPATGFFTWITTDEKQPLLGQINYQADSPYGRVSFLAPERAIKNSRPQALLEQMAKQAGQCGALHLLAEIDEMSPVFEVLRQAGFGIYARQRIWKIMEDAQGKDFESQWQPVKDRHTIAVQTLFHNVVPGMVCFKDNELVGYVDLKYGYRGIWSQPFIHPDVENIDDQLSSMINSIPDRRSRPVYVCVRTYQSWLEPTLGEMESQSSPLQAVMVKRLAIRQKLALQGLPHVEGQSEITAPVVHSQRNN
jgi:hypothetical protein